MFPAQPIPAPSSTKRSRKPFGNVENTQWILPVSKASSRCDTNKKTVGKARVQSLAKKFAPPKSDTTRYHPRTNSDHGSSLLRKPSKAFSSAAVVPKSKYRVVIYDESKNKSRPSPSPPPPRVCLPRHLPKTLPNDDFLARFKSVMATGYRYGTGHLDLRAAIQEGDPEWDDGSGSSSNPLNLDEIVFSEAQVQRIRVLIVPLDRYSAMDEMGRLLLGKQFGRRDKVFGPGYAYHVLRTYYNVFKQRYSNVFESKKRFNLLFGYSYHLYRNDWWMTHHPRGWGGEKMVAGLACRWKELLLHSARRLGLDEEFSYPAVRYFLDDFKQKLESVETYEDPPLRFPYC